MEGTLSYRDKVRNVVATKYDPMLEEASYWRIQIDGEKHADVEVATKAVLTGSCHLAEALHPVKAIPAELLPFGYSKSYAGFVLREENREVKVNQDIVKQEMEY